MTAALTATELKIFNRLSEARNRSTHLGTKIDAIIDALPIAQTPVNAVAATAELNVSGVALDSETVTIGDDVYEFLADDAQTKTTSTNIAVDIAPHAVKATGLLTVEVQPISGDTMTIGTRTYIFVPPTTDDGDRQITIGSDLATCQAAIIAAINGTDNHNIPHPLVSCGAFASDDAIITAKVGGTAGNSVVTTETFTSNSNIFGAGTLSSGANCSAANGASHLLAAINALGTEPVTAGDNGSNKISLTADVAGAAANDIALAETMTNGAFTGSVVKLAGGIDGTAAPKGTMMFDGSYLYIAVLANLVSGANWRRVSLGTVY